MSDNRCSICDKPLGFLDGKYKILNGEMICASCLNKAGGAAQLPAIRNMDSNSVSRQINEIAKKEAENKNRLNSFEATRKIGQFLYIDENKQQWVVPKGLFSKSIANSVIHDYKDILDFELLEDGTSVAKGGLGRAVAGGLLFGGVGAVVGGVTGGKKANQICTNLQVKITVNDMKNPTEYISFITTETKKNSFIYKAAYDNAQQVMSMLQIICESSKVSQNSNNSDENIKAKQTESLDPIEEIKKYKELLDMGVISQEEFDVKKKELLKL